MATLAVIVVSYNTRDLLRQALQAVLAAAPALQALPEAVALQLLVVDNASHDGSAAMVKAEFPATALLACPENLGFTGGNNAALAALGFPVPAHAWPETLHWVGAPVQQPDFVLLLNPDTAVEPAALAAMITALRPDESQAFLVGELAPAAQLDRGRDVLLLRSGAAPVVPGGSAAGVPRREASTAPVPDPPSTAAPPPAETPR